MNEDEKITAFRELVESIKENLKYLSEDFDPDTELEKGKRKIFRKSFLINNIENIKSTEQTFACPVLFLL